MTLPSLSWTNLTGIFLSVACVIHCMLMPLCLASLPSWGLEWMVSPRLHQSLALLGIIIGMAAIVPGWRKHRRLSIPLLALVGLMVMNYAAFAGDNCCAAPVAENNPACVAKRCEKSCCFTKGTPSTREEELPKANMSSSTAWLTGVWQWLWAHPTAFGAALLAWAHCLNGCCTRRCCQNQNEQPVMRVPID